MTYDIKVLPEEDRIQKKFRILFQLNLGYEDP